MRIGSPILLKLSAAVYISALAGKHALNGAGTMTDFANRFYIPVVNDRKKDGSIRVHLFNFSAFHSWILSVRFRRVFASASAYPAKPNRS